MDGHITFILPGMWADGLLAYAFFFSYLGQCRHLVSQETPLSGLCSDLHTLQVVDHCLVPENCLVMVPCKGEKKHNVEVHQSVQSVSSA